MPLCVAWPNAAAQPAPRTSFEIAHDKAAAEWRLRAARISRYVTASPEISLPQLARRGDCVAAVDYAAAASGVCGDGKARQVDEAIVMGLDLVE